MWFSPIFISTIVEEAPFSTNQGRQFPPIRMPPITWAWNQWQNYRNPSLFEKGSFFSDNIEPVYDAGQLKFVLEDIQFDEHIRLELYDGHTTGQIAVLFDTEEGNYAFPGDVVPTSLNLTLSWLSAYDNSVAVAMEEKKRFMNKSQSG